MNKYKAKNESIPQVEQERDLAQQVVMNMINELCPQQFLELSTKM